MTIEIVTAIIGLLCTVTASFVTFMLTKRKYDTEVEGEQIKNMNEVFDLYKKAVEETIASQNRRIDLLEKENEGLKQQVEQLQKQLTQLLIAKLGGDSQKKGR
jgi:citrate lyase synthetase